MTDEDRVQSALDRLEAKRAKKEEDDYAFFNSAPPDIQKAYYDYWIRSHISHDIPMPRFLIDFEKGLK